MAGNQKYLGRVQQAFWFTPEEKQALEALAIELRTSKSEIMRIALEKLTLELKEHNQIQVPKKQKFSRETDSLGVAA